MDTDGVINELIKEAALTHALKYLGQRIRQLPREADLARRIWKYRGWKGLKGYLKYKGKAIGSGLTGAWKTPPATWKEKYLLPGAIGVGGIAYGLGKRRRSKVASDDNVTKLAAAIYLADVLGKDLPLEKIPPEIFGRLLARYISEGGE